MPGIEAVLEKLPGTGAVLGNCLALELSWVAAWHWRLPGILGFPVLEAALKTRQWDAVQLNCQLKIRPLSTTNSSS